MHDSTKFSKSKGSIYWLTGPEESVCGALLKGTQEKLKDFNKINHSTSVGGREKKKERQKNTANNNLVAKHYAKGHFHC